MYLFCEYLNEIGPVALALALCPHNDNDINIQIDIWTTFLGTGGLKMDIFVKTHHRFFYYNITFLSWYTIHRPTNEWESNKSNVMCSLLKKNSHKLVNAMCISYDMSMQAVENNFKIVK